MSEVNYGLLQPIRPDAHVVATGTSTTSSSGIGDAARGLLQGLEVGSNLKTQALQRQVLQQRMDQSAQLFPSILTQNQNAAETSTMALEGAKQNAQDQATLRKAALQGPDQFSKTLEVMSRANPGVAEAYQTYQLKKAQAAQAFANAAKTDADTAAQQAKNYDLMVNKAGQVARAAAQGATPQMQQAIWQFGLSQLPPQISKVMPSQYDQLSGAALSQLSHESAMDQAHQNLEKNPNDLQKNQMARDIIQQRVTSAQKSGQQPDPMDVQNLKELNEAINNDLVGRGNQGNDAQKAINQEDAKTMAKNDQSQAAFKSFLDDTHTVETILAKIPHGWTGKIVDLTKLNINNSEVQELQSRFKDMALISKSALAGQTAGMRLTGSEFDALVSAAGNTSLNWDALKNIVADNKLKAQSRMHDAWAQSAGVRANGDKDKYDAWVKANPEPYDPSKANQPTQWSHNGRTVLNSDMQRAREANPGLSDDEIAKRFALTQINPGK